MQPAMILNPLSSLPQDLIWYISQFVLENDVVDYITLRAVCHDWRLYIDPPVGLDSQFRPRRWIMLSEGNDANLDRSRRRFLNLSTGRCLTLHLPPLDTFSVFSDPDGLLFLIDLPSRDVRLFNPFTGHLAHLPTFPSYSCTKVYASFMRNFSSSSISTGSCPTVMLFNKILHVICYAKPGDSSWVVYFFPGACPNSMLCFRDQFYFADHPIHGIQRYHLQERSFTPVIPLNHIVAGSFNRFFLAEFNKEMLLLHRKNDLSFTVYRVDLESNRLVPRYNNRDLAIFLGKRCFVLSLNDEYLRSLKPNSVYFCVTAQPFCYIVVYKMDDNEGDVLHNGSNLMHQRHLTLALKIADYCLYSY